MCIILFNNLKANCTSWWDLYYDHMMQLLDQFTSSKYFINMAIWVLKEQYLYSYQTNNASYHNGHMVFPYYLYIIKVALLFVLASHIATGWNNEACYSYFTCTSWMVITSMQYICHMESLCNMHTIVMHLDCRCGANETKVEEIANWMKALLFKRKKPLSSFTSIKDTSGAACLTYLC